MALLAALFFLLTSARAYLPCSYTDIKGDEPVQVETTCPGEQNYNEPDFPPTPPGAVWIRSKDSPREYFTGILLREIAGGRQVPAMPPPPGHDFPFARIRCSDKMDTHQVNPDSEDYLRRAVAEVWLGRLDWANAYASQGLAMSPGNKRLQAVVAKTAAYAAPQLTLMFSAQDAFNNGHRAMEHGDPAQALAWFDRSIAVRPTAQAYFYRSQLRRVLGRAAEALKDAEDGLAMTPNDLMLKSARDQAAQALAAKAAPPPPKPAAPVAMSEAKGPPEPQLNTAYKSAFENHDLGHPVLAEALPAAKRAIYSPSFEDRPPLAVNGHSPFDAPAKKLDDRPILFAILGLLMLGAGGGYQLARRHARLEFEKRASSSATPTIVDLRTLKDGTRSAPPTLRRYEVRQRIGAGGMGIVYEAYERDLGRRVAVKQMRSEIKDEERERAAFLKEAEIISGLKHPAIVEFREIVQEEGEIFLIFEYIEGKPLSKLLADKGRLRLNECREIFSQVCSAVSCAHRMHVLHRDLKPSNIMVDDRGVVKVMDFGIARKAKETITKLTRADASGTPAYMAPEQHLGECAKPSDIYALGVCLYEALTGRLPFPGPDFLAQKERMHYASAKLLSPDLPKEVDLLFKATLALKPEHRVADAEELIGSLRALST